MLWRQSNSLGSTAASCVVRLSSSVSASWLFKMSAGVNGDKAVGGLG